MLIVIKQLAKTKMCIKAEMPNNIYCIRTKVKFEILIQIIDRNDFV